MGIANDIRNMITEGIYAQTEDLKVINNQVLEDGTLLQMISILQPNLIDPDKDPSNTSLNKLEKLIKQEFEERGIDENIAFDDPDITEEDANIIMEIIHRQTYFFSTNYDNWIKENILTLRRENINDSLLELDNNIIMKEINTLKWLRASLNSALACIYGKVKLRLFPNKENSILEKAYTLGTSLFRIVNSFERGFKEITGPNDIIMTPEEIRHLKLSEIPDFEINFKNMEKTPDEQKQEADILNLTIEEYIKKMREHVFTKPIIRTGKINSIIDFCLRGIKFEKKEMLSPYLDRIDLGGLISASVDANVATIFRGEGTKSILIFYINVSLASFFMPISNMPHEREIILCCYFKRNTLGPISLISDKNTIIELKGEQILNKAFRSTMVNAYSEEIEFIYDDINYDIIRHMFVCELPHDAAQKMYPNNPVIEDCVILTAQDLDDLSRKTARYLPLSTKIDIHRAISEIDHDVPPCYSEILRSDSFIGNVSRISLTSSSDQALSSQLSRQLSNASGMNIFRGRTSSICSTGSHMHFERSFSVNENINENYDHRNWRSNQDDNLDTILYDCNTPDWEKSLADDNDILHGTENHASIYSDAAHNFSTISTSYENDTNNIDYIVDTLNINLEANINNEEHNISPLANNAIMQNTTNTTLQTNLQMPDTNNLNTSSNINTENIENNAMNSNFLLPDTAFTNRSSLNTVAINEGGTNNDPDTNSSNIRLNVRQQLRHNLPANSNTSLNQPLQRSYRQFLETHNQEDNRADNLAINQYDDAYNNVTERRRRQSLRQHNNDDANADNRSDRDFGSGSKVRK